MDNKLLRLLAEEKTYPSQLLLLYLQKVPYRAAPAQRCSYILMVTHSAVSEGGYSEAEVIGIASKIIGTGRYCLHTVDLTADDDEEEGMVCGGVMQVLIEDY